MLLVRVFPRHCDSGLIWEALRAQIFFDTLTVRDLPDGIRKGSQHYRTGYVVIFLSENAEKSKLLFVILRCIALHNVNGLLNIWIAASSYCVWPSSRAAICAAPVCSSRALFAGAACAPSSSSPCPRPSAGSTPGEPALERAGWV